jgi:opacity protein-like surface antigen
MAVVLSVPSPNLGSGDQYHPQKHQRNQNKALAAAAAASSAVAVAVAAAAAEAATPVPTGNIDHNEDDEGLMMGYRWYDQHQLEPLFPFGHGLGYANWSFSTEGFAVTDTTNTMTSVSLSANRTLADKATRSFTATMNGATASDNCDGNHLCPRMEPIGLPRRSDPISHALCLRNNPVVELDEHVAVVTLDSDTGNVDMDLAEALARLRERLAAACDAITEGLDNQEQGCSNLNHTVDTDSNQLGPGQKRPRCQNSTPCRKASRQRPRL